MEKRVTLLPIMIKPVESVEVPWIVGNLDGPLYVEVVRTRRDRYHPLLDPRANPMVRMWYVKGGLRACDIRPTLWHHTGRASSNTCPRPDIECRVLGPCCGKHCMVPEGWCHVTCTQPVENRFYYNIGKRRFLQNEGHWMINNKVPKSEQECICCMLVWICRTGGGQRRGGRDMATFGPKLLW